jgi:hypothetical protein
MNVRHGGIVLLLSALSLILSGCRITGAARPSGGNPSIRGTVVTIAAPSRVISGFMVEGHQDADTTYDKASVRVTEGTHVFIKQGENYTEASASALQVGQAVEVWFTGPVAESYPVQATAQQIVIVR